MALHNGSYSSTQMAGSNAGPTPTQNTSGSFEDLIRVFNTAMVTTRMEQEGDFSSELLKIMESPAFRAILNAVRQYARLNGISDRQAAEQVILTFRQVDRLWSDYIFREGIERIKGQEG